jgi:hypothetical protein
MQFMSSTTGHTSNLQFGDYLLQSAEGAQQVITALLLPGVQGAAAMESVRSELVLGYLADVAMGGEAMCLLKDFLHLGTVGEKVGLELNRSKFEVRAHHRDTGYVHIIRH